MMFDNNILQVVFFLCVLVLLFFSTRKEERVFKIYMASFFLFFVALPLKVSWGNVAMYLLLVISVFYFFRNKGRGITSNLVFYGLVGLFLIRLVGILYSICPNGGTVRLGQGMSLLVFPVIFSIRALDLRQIRIVLTFFVRYVMLFCLFCLVLLYFVLPTIGVSYVECVDNPKAYYFYMLVWPSFWHPSFVSIIISMAIPVAFYLRFGKLDKRMSTIEMILLILLVSAVVFLTGARIGLIVVPLLVLLSSLYYLSVSKWVKFALVAIAFATIPFVKVDYIEKKMQDPIREQQRATAIEAIKENPIFGWGAGSMEPILKSQAFAYELGYDVPMEFNHFHNAYLDELVQFGVVGSLLLFSLIAYLIYLAVIKKDFLLMAFLAIYLPFMWVESPFCTSKGIMPMIFWLCFIVATQSVRQVKAIEEPAKS